MDTTIELIEMSADNAKKMRAAYITIPFTQKLIDEIRIFLESDPIILGSYQFWPLLSMKWCIIVDSISCFPYNSTKCELRMTLESL